MILFAAPTSPYSWKVQLVISYLGLEGEIAIEAISSFDDAARLFDLNPLGKVPFLLVSEGQGVSDSSVI